jgi:tetratricopeptide (TPR) repeat protein
MELEQTDSAILEFSEAIRIDSVNTFALFNRSLAYLKIPDQVAALKDLNQVVRLSPYNSYAYYNRAIVLIGLGDRYGAIRDFEMVSRLDPKHIVSYFYRSKLKTEVKDYQGALADLDKTIELLPEYTEAWYDRYELKLKLNDRKGAMTDYNRALELMRKNHLNADSIKNDRIEYLKKLTKLSGDFEQMNAMSQKLQNQSAEIQLKPMFNLLIWKSDFEKVRPYDVYKKEHYLSNILMFTNMTGVVGDSVLLAEAAAMNHILDSIPADRLALFRRAITLDQLHLYEAAFRDISQYLDLDTNNVAAWFCRAGIRYELIRKLLLQDELQQEVTIGMNFPQQKDETPPAAVEHTYELVIADYNRALHLDPGFAYGLYNRGYVNARMGNYRESLDDFSRAVACIDDFAEAWYNRGLVSILLNENHNGCKDLSRAGELGVADAYRVMKRYCYK